MTQAVLNHPVDLRSLLPLLPAEQKFARRLGEGKPCEVGNGKLPALDNRGESGDAANVVRAEVIRFFAYGGDEKHPVQGAAIQLWGAWICGEEPLDLMHADIPYALGFFHCHFAVEVNMRHAKCEALYLEGSRLTKGVAANGLKTKGNVHLRDGFSAKGAVRLLGADIGGQLDCTGGKFHNRGGKALIADQLTAKSGVFLSGGFFAEGAVRLLGADIGGQLNCTGGKFHNQGGKALIADQLTAKGGVFLSGGFSAKGDVRLTGANIGGHLTCMGGEFHNPDGFALIAEHAKIGDGLHWRGMKGEGVVNLSSAKAGVLEDDLDSWKPFKVVLDGFTYGQFAGLMSPTDADLRLKWLANRPSKLPDGTPLSFSPLPYEQAAKVLFGMGHDDDAWEILLEKERIRMRQEKESGGTFSPVAHEAAANVLFAMGRGREARDTLWEKEDLLTKRGDFPRWWKFGRRVWDFLAGYGYRPWKRTFTHSLAVILFGAAVFAFADYHGNIVPTHPVVTLSEDYKAKVAPAGDLRPTRAVPPEYPAFNPVVFSLDVFTPSAVFHQEDSWGPRFGGGDWLSPEVGVLWLLTGWYWFQVAAGWVLVPLFLLSLTGLLRPRQSSGERD